MITDFDSDRGDARLGPDSEAVALVPMDTVRSEPAPPPPKRPPAAGIPLAARRRIGRNLRLLYADVLDQPLPDRFEALLADLAANSPSRGSS